MNNYTCHLNKWNMTAERYGYVFASPILGAIHSVQQRVSESLHLSPF
ncbi:MAG: hypothetical protein WAT81_01910 [Candidatus Moraniibacteriota bacterium]